MIGSRIQRDRPEKFILADSRERIDLFRNGRKAEHGRMSGGDWLAADEWQQAIRAQRDLPPRVFARGQDGIALPAQSDGDSAIPGFPVRGPSTLLARATVARGKARW
jgi:hypothetical protein